MVCLGYTSRLPCDRMRGLILQLSRELATCTGPLQQQQFAPKNVGTVVVTTFYIPQSKTEDSARQWKIKTTFLFGECPACQA